MSNKRTASTDLNHDNWDDEEEPEMIGKFQTAKASVIASRQIKHATRRLQHSSGGVSDTTNKADSLLAPKQTVFHMLGGSFACAPKKAELKRTAFFNRPEPEVLNENQDLLNSTKPAIHVENKAMESQHSNNKDVTTVKDRPTPGTSALWPVNRTKLPSTSQYEPTTAAWGTKSMVDLPFVDKPRVPSIEYSRPVKLALSMNRGSATSLMPCLETRPVAESTSTETEILSKRDSRHLLKPVPEDILARLKSKSEATAKSVNFLKRTYQLNITTLDWMQILVKESLTVNIAEVIPSYMHELLKLIEEEIASQTSNEAKQHLIPHKDQLQKMLGMFQQDGLVAEDGNSSKSEMLPESAKNMPTLKTPLVANKLETCPQSTTCHDTKEGKISKVTTANQEEQHNVPNEQQGSEQPENEEDESSKADAYIPVVEEGSVCTMRCKVFVKKVLDPSEPSDTPYQNRGVGTLFVKPITPGKLQLVVRADNSLGNIILNTCITPEIPTEIANANTLMLVCCPMPGDTARTVLIRVKNKVQVDLLHSSLVTV